MTFGMRAEIVSITFTSSKCWYCSDKPWKYELEVATAYPGGELTGKTTEMYVCQDCRDAMKIPEERIKVIRTREPCSGE